jgi:hypothetical protein
MNAMVKCKRVMRLMLRPQDFIALNVAIPVFPALRIDPDQELSIINSIRTSGLRNHGISAALRRVSI